MKTYTPKPGELEEMGFEDRIANYGRMKTYKWHQHKSCPIIYNSKGEWILFLEVVYPSSKSDIETIIRLFSKP